MAFLTAQGWASALRQPIATDASAREYTRLTLASRSAILMDARPGTGDDPADFVRIARHLSTHGLSVPVILAEDLNDGFLLLEDFGDARFAELLANEPSRSEELYAAATDTLVQLARVPQLPGLPDLSAAEWASAACAGLDPGTPTTAQVTAVLTEALLRHADGPRIFIHRDYHAENLMLLPGRSGFGCIGLLDFQLGQAGQPGYDLVSVLQDARRDVDAALERAMMARYCQAMSLEPAAFSTSYAVLGVQRALRILGVFAGLAARGKPRYVVFVPRVSAHLQRNLAHPALADLRRACEGLPT